MTRELGSAAMPITQLDSRNFRNPCYPNPLSDVRLVKAQVRPIEVVKLKEDEPMLPNAASNVFTFCNDTIIVTDDSTDNSSSDSDDWHTAHDSVPRSPSPSLRRECSADQAGRLLAKTAVLTTIHGIDWLDQLLSEYRRAHHGLRAALHLAHVTDHVRALDYRKLSEKTGFVLNHVRKCILGNVRSSLASQHSSLREMCERQHTEHVDWCLLSALTCMDYCELLELLTIHDAGVEEMNDD